MQVRWGRQVRAPFKSTREVYDALASHLFGDHIYRNFLELPEGAPAIKFTAIKPGEPLQVAGYRILPVTVGHSVPTVGLQVASADGKILFYTSDTGAGLRQCWQQLFLRFMKKPGSPAR